MWWDSWWGVFAVWVLAAVIVIGSTLLFWVAVEVE